MPWFLYLALKQLFPTGRRFPFFTFMSTLGVSIGVLILVVATSVMGGFGHDIKRMIVDTQGEIQIVPDPPEIFAPAETLAKVLQHPAVEAATPYARGNVLLQFNDRPAWGPFIQGVEVRQVEQVVPFGRYMVAGSLADLDDDSLILSKELAKTLGVQIGDEIDIYSPLLLQPSAGEVLLPRTVRVVGIFQVGHPQLDRSLAISTLRLMQELYRLRDGVHAVMVRLKPGADEFKVAGELNRTLPRGMRAITWFEANADFQSIIQFEKYMIFFLLMFIVLVAALAIMSSLSIAVVRKTREIGLLGALGGSSRDVALCFCTQGFLLGTLGTAIGLGLAWLVLTFRNEIVSGLARIAASEEVFQQFYGYVRLPSHTSGSDLAAIIVGSIVSATVAGLLPALRAAKLKPVEALRSE
ncbi:MAG: ABC transporter permease [Opitutaceae bacterium]